ncbi:MAG: hypothetical protein QNJ90_06670 [Planctomycetota bacterium]|nr:hypothetical protein [Planctomycetota bacterium]
MGRLQARLDRMREGAKAQIPEAAQAVMARATEDLRTSGILESIPQAGGTLPAFELTDSEGDVHTSEALLARGPLVLTFYRGDW